MRKLLAFILFMVVIVVGVSPEDSCCSEEEASSSISMVFSDATDNAPIQTPVNCECPQCISCLRCGHFSVNIGNPLVVEVSITDASDFAEYGSFFAPSPYIPGLKRPPIV